MNSKPAEEYEIGTIVRLPMPSPEDEATTAKNQVMVECVDEEELRTQDPFAYYSNKLRRMILSGLEDWTRADRRPRRRQRLGSEEGPQDPAARVVSQGSADSTATDAPSAASGAVKRCTRLTTEVHHSLILEDLFEAMDMFD